MYIVYSIGVRVSVEPVFDEEDPFIKPSAISTLQIKERV